MKFVLVNPNWDFTGSTYFGCRDAHVPLELLFAADQINAAGHEALVLDAHMHNLTLAETYLKADAFQPDFLVISTAPTYLFWRCPPPELRVPQEWAQQLCPEAVKVLIGPHASATPAAVIRKTGCGVAMRGEPDQTLAELATRPWSEIPGCCFKTDDGMHISSTLAVADMKTLAPLTFGNYRIEAHSHRHHVFTGDPALGAELEFARGCPWSCTFCNKTLFRNRFRERRVDTVLAEVDALLARGVSYIYFIDEVFGVGQNARRLLEGLAERPLTIGLQTRIDLWDETSLDLLARAHCISMECGIESISEEGRDELNKNCRIPTSRITELLLLARRRIPWVQANLVLTEKDNREQIRSWQDYLNGQGVWVSEPVPMFPYPGSPLYSQTFGAVPDDDAWERAHHYYTATFGAGGYSDIQERKPVPIEELEHARPSDH
ncbi:MAG TPA: TIGR04295 family B12-binding domain-containing radical SAM protein [Candidatus Angelobacter sp.]|nr:TIGR04295 family B12-binding domain-containing radical SAM protein [Candidatus Angelobacter sp.]